MMDAAYRRCSNILYGFERYKRSALERWHFTDAENTVAMKPLVESQTPPSSADSLPTPRAPEPPPPIAT
jgi:hypothetical protein